MLLTEGADEPAEVPVAPDPLRRVLASLDHEVALVLVLGERAWLGLGLGSGLGLGLGLALVLVLGQRTCKRVGAQIFILGRAFGGLAGGFEGDAATA